MRWHLLLVIPALAWTGEPSAGGDDEAPLPPVVREAPPKQQAPKVAEAKLPVVAAPQPLIEPPKELVIPPELVDDGSDDLREPDLTPAPNTPDRPELASTAHETWVFAEPRWRSRKIGYLRAGAVVARSRDAVSRAGCSEGWYRVEPRGYVCAGAAATLNVSDPVVETSFKRPRRDGLPYLYAMSRFPPPPFYVRLPSRSEIATTEPDIAGHLRKIALTSRDADYVAPPPAEPTPGVLLYGRSAPGLGDQPKRSSRALTFGHAKARSGFALLSTFDYEDRRYGLTTDLTVIPIDRTRVVKPSSFHGITLDDEVSLPVAFVRSKHASRWQKGPSGGITRGAPLGFREAVPLTGREHRIGGVSYWEAKDGSFIMVDQAVRIDAPRSYPAWSAGGRKWIDVSILKQSLVAYEGKKPVYATLVSTGADGIGDPKKTRSTIQGAFLIHTKHVSVTMDEDKAGDQFDFRDVPFVQYFTEGFALHAAYWHDEFGTPRSHGCVNLAPIDAAWLFNWTTPEVPAAWHAALSLKRGTLVFTHP